MSHSPDTSIPLTPDPDHPDSFRMLVTVVSIVSIGLTIFSVYVTYQNIQLKRLLATVKTYEECVKSNGARIQESSPPVCITSEGMRFTQ